MNKDMKVWAIKLRGRSFYKDSYDIPFLYPTRCLAMQEAENIADWKNRNPNNRSPRTEIIRVKVCIEETDDIGDAEAFNDIERQAKQRMEAVRVAVQTLSEYERGFIDGMQKQMQSSVDKAVNAMSQRTWVGLTDDDIDKVQLQVILSSDRGKLERDGRVDDRLMYRAIEQKLKEKNNGVS